MLRTDLRYAFRALARNPGFAALSILALALGIAATTTMFSALDAVVLGAYRTLPGVDRLVQVWDRYPETEPGSEVQVSVPNFEDYAANQTVFERLAAFQPTPLYLETPEGQTSAAGLHASADLLALMGVTPALGRAFTAESDLEGTAHVVMITHEYWQRQFGGDPDIVGRVVRMARFKAGQGGWATEPYEIGAVLPPGFQLPPLRLRHEFAPLRTPDVILPLGLWTWGRGNRGMFALRVLGRLEPGVTLERAQEDLSAIARGIAEANPSTNDGYGVVVTPLQRLVRDAHGRRMLILLSAAGLLLLIACANVAGLLLGRALARERELAIRKALGAGRRRLLRQLLTESAVLATLGGLAGIALAAAMTGLLRRLVPPGIHGFETIGVDPRVLGFALLTSALATLLFGLLPGLHGSRARGDRTLRPALQGDARTRARSFGGLVAAQVALAFVLLCSAGLLFASLTNLLRSDAGFDGDGVVLVRAATLPPPLSKFGGREAQAVLYDRVMESVRAVAGVEGAAVVSHAPLEGREPSADFTLADRPLPPPAEREYADWIFTSPGYFELMGIEVIEGRGFEESDVRERTRPVPGQPLPELPVVVNDRFAARHWPGESALGRVFYWGLQDPATVATGSYETGEWDSRYPSPYPLRIVGVVRQVNLLGLGEEDRLQYYTVGDQLQGRWIVVRVGGDASAAAPAIRAAITGVDAELSVADIVPMVDRVRAATATARFQLFLVGAFATLATLLAAVGLFGVVAFAARRRTREFGVRLALGASTGSVLRLVLSRGLRLTGLGLLVGTALFLAVARLLGALLYDIAPTDPRVLAAGALLITGAAAAACLAPAVRAARLDPARTLREE